MTSIITSLHELVTPQALQATSSYEGSDTEKKGALTTLYTLLSARMSDTAVIKRTETVAEADNADSLLSATIYEGVAPAGFSNSLYETIATNHNLPVATVSALAAAALPKVYHHIKSAAGVTPVPDYLATERDSLISGVPAWLVAALPAGLLVATPTPVVKETVTTTGTLHKQEKPEGSFMKALLPIIGALIFAGLAFLLLKSCQKTPAPVAAPVVTETTVAPATVTAVAVSPAMLAVALNETGSDVYSCEGDVGSAGLASELTGHVAGVFPAHNCYFETDAIYSSDMPASQYVPQILALMKGVPDASVVITDYSVILNSSDTAQADLLVTNVRELLPSEFTVVREPDLDEAAAIAASIAAAQAALDALTTTSTLNELVRALNLQVINFALDSDEIPDENKAILDIAAARLKELPQAHLAITGHTDNQGSLEYNQDLSERRAKAVHDYLVAQGVNDDKLDTSGASYTRPVATNSTPQGRFKNRRIEFTISHDGEMIDTVGSADGASAVTDTVAGATGAVVDTAKDAASAAGDAVADAANTVQKTTTGQ